MIHTSIYPFTVYPLVQPAPIKTITRSCLKSPVEGAFGIIQSGMRNEWYELQMMVFASSQRVAGYRVFSANISVGGCQEPHSLLPLSVRIERARHFPCIPLVSIAQMMPGEVTQEGTSFLTSRTPKPGYLAHHSLLCSLLSRGIFSAYRRTFRCLPTRATALIAVGLHRDDTVTSLLQRSPTPSVECV